MKCVELSENSNFTEGPCINTGTPNTKIECSCGKIYCSSCHHHKLKKCYKCHAQICKEHAKKKWFFSILRYKWVCKVDCDQSE